MQNTLWTIALLLALNSASLDAGESASKSDSNVIAKVLPADYAAYRKAVIGDNGVGDASAAVMLLVKARELLSKLPSRAEEQEDRSNAYRATWRLCLQLMRDTKDKAARQLILDEWNKSLTRDDDGVPSQLYALSERWDQELITDDFWNLLRQAKTRRTVSAMCYLLYVHGNQADLDRLQQRLRSLPTRGDERRGPMQNAVNWMKYRLSSNTKTDPGPAHRPPRME